MKPFEWIYFCAEPFLPVIYRNVRKRLLEVVRPYPYRPEILDVGGRKSHYTIGVPADITITDLYKETEVQKKLGLGINQEIIDLTYKRRSNIKKMVIDDMTHSSLPDCCFDCVIAVEVLEHVEEDDLFIQQAYRVLKPGGVFLITTPNGDHLLKSGPPWKFNPDHKRFYTRERLKTLLVSYFKIVEIEYAVRVSGWSRLGLKPWSHKRPLVTVMSMIGNFINSVESCGKAVRGKAQNTKHLIAIAKKPD